MRATSSTTLTSLATLVLLALSALQGAVAAPVLIGRDMAKPPSSEFSSASFTALMHCSKPSTLIFPLPLQFHIAAIL